jgi:uncharacterized protein
MHCFVGVGPCCRFTPTCSLYTRQAVRRFGWIVGSRLSLLRVARCLPGGGFGFDPVPDRTREREKRSQKWPQGLG